MIDEYPAKLWRYYTQLAEVEEAFRILKGDWALRPIYHQWLERVEARIFVAFLTCCLHATLRRWLLDLVTGLIARAALEKFVAVQMLNVHLPTTDGRRVILTRYTRPARELQVLLEQLKLTLPDQLPPKITESDTWSTERL